ncbi:hypothetical protein [Kordia sp.]|uniref:hypothetical protein n=1 Tax=Kordia sp. TaxID=1965332 RepID=UPI003D295185
MKKTLHHFVHTTQEINGKEVTSEFLVPDVIDHTQMFIGLSSGKKYSKATIVATSRAWDEKDLLKLLKRVKTIGFFGNSKKKFLLKRYIEQLINMRKNYSDLVVALDQDLNLIRIDSFSNFMNKKSLKLTQETDVKKQAYRNLSKICLNEKDYLQAEIIINKLKNYDGHWKHDSTFNFLLNQLEKKDIYLFLCFDWKYSIIDFYAFIKMVVKKNYRYNLELKYQNNYSNKSTISSKGFFLKYKDQLNKEGFDYCLLEQDGDQYVILICEINDIINVQNSISIIE